MVAKNFELGLIIWKTHGDGEDEAVQLGLREGKGAGRRRVILSGNNEEGIGELACCAINCHLPFVHGFEK